MSTISNLERMKAQTLGNVKDFEKRAMLESTRCQPWDQVLQRSLRKYVFQHILKLLKLTFINQRMLAVLITLTPGRWNGFIDRQTAKFHIAVQPITDLNKHWNWSLELLECTYQLCEFTGEWLKTPEYTDHRPLYTIQDEWTIVKYLMEVLRPFCYWVLWM